MPAVGNFTGELVKSSRPRTYNAIVEAVARDQGVNSIARAHGVSNHTVGAIAKRESVKIAARKKTLATMFETICEKSVLRATKTVKTATYAQAMVGAGIAADKMMSLRGEAQADRGLTINLLNITGGT